eukprot:TRINITY_DN117349_c0_g1_i1.p1 TRINITY_DN117349_c0_g1~~TRINITY_DN117349_c0_g1_i1.p1  ORF type:complete len:246 (-),score=42.37 TRINITY_DN117349_c0_g1_i1:84-821(-)
MVQGPRALIQLFLTGFTLATAVTGMAFAYVFGNYVDQMSENFRGDLKSVNLPCIRHTLAECDSSQVDKCWDYCCPPGYFCARSPIVGLYCQDGVTNCGDHNYCRDLSDIPLTCPTDTCKEFNMVKRVSTVSYIMSCIGIFLDLIDAITICTVPDLVIFKSGVNIFSSLMKLVAFGCVIGAGTQKFLVDLKEAQCYNADGMTMVTNAEGYFWSYAVVQVLSASLSLVVAPISAYYGGKLQGVPYVK